MGRGGEREAGKKGTLSLFSFACEGKQKKGGKQKNKNSLFSLSLSIRRRSLGRAWVFFVSFFFVVLFLLSHPPSLSLSFSLCLSYRLKRKKEKKKSENCEERVQGRRKKEETFFPSLANTRTQTQHPRPRFLSRSLSLSLSLSRSLALSLSLSLFLSPSHQTMPAARWITPLPSA